MFDRKDAVPVLFLLLLILAIVVTLSQILVVHHHNHHSNRDSKNYKELQSMLNQLERTVQKVMKSNVLSQKKYENALLGQIYAARVRGMLEIIQNNKTRKEQARMSDSSKQYVIDQDRKARVLQNSKRARRYNSREEYYKVKTKAFSDEKVVSLREVTGLHGRISSAKETVGKTNGIIGGLQRGVNYADANKHASRQSNIKRLFQSFSDQSADNTDKTLKRKPSTAKTKDICPELPKHLIGPLEVIVNISETREEIPVNMDLEPGGQWRPDDCVARHRVAIVIPYRDRKVHLETLLYHLLPILQRQQLDFRVFVVEQSGNDTFNKGRLMNAGFTEAWKMSDFNCFIFHDVDLIPEDDRNMYSCPPSSPRHMSVAVDKFNYTLPYPRLVGGVFSISREHFLKVNGYSNLYWGWGAEDDDMALRLKEVKLEISRPPPKVARYKMIKHDTRETLPYQWTYYMLRTLRKRFKKDGLNSLNYKVVSIDNKRTYTHIMVNVGEAPKKRVFL